MRKWLIVFFIGATICTMVVQPAFAQETGPVYIVQSGDTFYSIAARFNVSVGELVAANLSVDPNSMAVGQEILIPGLTGVSGRLETEVVQFGDSLRALIRRTQSSDESLRKLNRLISPSELYVGISLIVPLQAGRNTLSTRITPTTGESLLELALKEGTDAWTLSTVNKLAGTWAGMPGDVLYSADEDNSAASTTGLPSVFLSASIAPLPLVQGSTAVIRVNTEGNVPASGMLIDKPLNFFATSNEQIALQGVHALLEPGVYPFRIEATGANGTKQSFEQMVLVIDGDYYHEDLVVDPATLDPVVTEPENNTLLSIILPATPIKYWEGSFTSPAVFPDEFTSYFGTRRTYHGSGTEQTIEGFHTGLDFAGGDGLQIFAPAPGRVVFAAPMTVRGNATIIDHGWGVYSGFWHQSEIDVHVGDLVDQGRVIGLVGGTGRVTGAHLHWELWVNGVQVNPLDWLNQAYP